MINCTNKTLADEYLFKTFCLTHEQFEFAVDNSRKGIFYGGRRSGKTFAIAHAIAKQALELEHVIFAGFTHQPAELLSQNLLEILLVRFHDSVIHLSLKFLISCTT